MANTAQLKRIRWVVRIVLTLGVAVSVAANILHANPNPISQAISAWPPLALLLTVELVSRIPVHSRALSAVRILATAAIAGIAAWVSYWHMASVASEYGETDASPYLLPLTVDGLIVVASVSLVELGRILRAREFGDDVPVVAPVVEQVAAPVVALPVPVPVSPAPRRPKGRMGPQVTGPSKRSSLTGRPLMEDTPKR